LRCDAVLDGGHAVGARGAPAEGLREPGHAGDLRVVLGADDQAGSEAVGQQDAGLRPVMSDKQDLQHSNALRIDFLWCRLGKPMLWVS
jgi:hypothetical protein